MSHYSSDPMNDLGDEFAKPLPWVVDVFSDEHFYQTNHKYCICSETAPIQQVACVEGMGKRYRDLAGFIVRACNNHEQLVAACEAAVVCFEGCITLAQSSYETPPEPASEWDYEASIIISRLRTAIAAAKGE